MFAVGQVVVVFAEWEEVVEVGGAAVFPVVDVVRFGDADVAFAARDGTGAVHGSECAALVAVGVPA